MNIAKLNDIFVARGAAAALASARAAMMDSWIIDLLEAGTWEPGKKSEPRPAPVTSTKGDVLQPLRTMPARIGKTDRSGGLVSAQKRKAQRAERDRAIRDAMKGASSGGGNNRKGGKK